MKKVGFLGPKGTFSQEAFNICYKNQKVEAVEYITINDLILAIKNEKIKEAIVPIENSIEGSVTATLDSILITDLNIIKEIVIPIRHNLLGKKEIKKNQIELIYTHPQPAGQCREYLNNNFSCVQIIYTDSTSEGAKRVLDGNGKGAAIGSENMAYIYGLDIIESNIEDNDNNQTRFVVLSKDSCQKTGKDKTSIVFSTDDKPGSLYRILDIFSLWDINLTKIESRPQKNELGKYIFFVDIEGHIEDEDIKDALTMVKRKTSFLKLLGSYPKWK